MLYSSNINSATENEMTKEQAAIRNAAKFNTYSFAKECSARQKYHTQVLLGDDELYFVPSTHRETGVLFRAGYEAAQ